MHIVITGASSGIGAALARELGAAGHSLTLVARRKELLDALARDIDTARASVDEDGPRTHVVPHDLSDPTRATEWLAAAEEALGPVDVLINNAGVQIVAPTETVDPTEGERLIAIDLLSPLRLTRAVLPNMIARGKGVIVDVASMAALAPTAGMTHYNAAKAGLAAASEAMRGELRGTGVHVITVYPGIIDTTDMAKAAIDKFEPSFLLSRAPRGTAVILAQHVRRAIEKKTARVIYPRSGAWSRWFPTLTRVVMDRFTPRLRARSDDAKSADTKRVDIKRAITSTRTAGAIL
jgi:short-subunit dehydrogenase